MLLTQRTKSHSKDLCAHNKPKFQTKYRTRSGHKSMLDIDNFDQKNTSSNSFMSDKKDRSQSLVFGNTNGCPLNDSFNKTSSQLKTINFQHHDPNLCVCAQCNCGRHLCKLHAIKPDLPKSTIYKKDYFKKKPIENKINLSHEYDRLKGPNLDLNSTYFHDFDGKKG